MNVISIGIIIACIVTFVTGVVIINSTSITYSFYYYFNFHLSYCYYTYYYHLI